jgi:hypothetical protein
MQVLGDYWTQAAEPIRHVHSTYSTVQAHGCLRITHGRRFVGRVIAQVMRLPSPGASVETRLIVTAHRDREHWRRTFSGRPLESWQYQSRAFEIAERFGMFEVRFELQISGGSLLYVQREAAFLFGSVRLRIPARWAPLVQAREDPAGRESIRVDVRVTLPCVGLLMAYDGVVTVGDAHA